MTAIYVALLPAVLAYNYYFVRLAPRFDASMTELRRAMDESTYGVLIDALGPSIDWCTDPSTGVLCSVASSRSLSRFSSLNGSRRQYHWWQLSRPHPGWPCS